jgi:acetate kinase
MDNDMNILVFNCGSSSQNYKLYQASDGGFDLICKGKAHRVGVVGKEPSFIEHAWDGHSEHLELPLPNHAAAAGLILDFLQAKEFTIDSIGHRFVHGGSTYQRSIVITPEVYANLPSLNLLAPIHNPNSLSVINVCRERLPDLPETLTFDTAFHAGMPESAYTYALPAEWRERFRLRKYGFHGLSYQYVTRKAADFLQRPLESLRMVACHLGTGGSSAVAIDGGISIDTSMGYSPLPGLMMSTRSGDLDAGIVVELLKQGLTSTAISDLLNKRSGLLGVSGFSSDIRDVLAAAAQDENARLAIDLYTQRLRKTIGAFITLLGGIDALLFTDDIGLQNPAVREMACRGLGWAGVELDELANEAALLDSVSDVSREGSATRILVLPTDEERVIAEETLRVLAEAAHG